MRSVKSLVLPAVIYKLHVEVYLWLLGHVTHPFEKLPFVLHLRGLLGNPTPSSKSSTFDPMRVGEEVISTKCPSTHPNYPFA